MILSAGKNKQLKDQHANKRTGKKDTNNRSKKKKHKCKKKTLEQISAVSNRDVSKQTRRRYQNDVIRRWSHRGGNSLPNSAVRKKETTEKEKRA